MTTIKFVNLFTKLKSSQYLNALVLFSLITSEIFQLTHRYRYQVCRLSNDRYFKHKRNDPMCDPWGSQGDKKMQFLFLLLFALTF